MEVVVGKVDLTGGAAVGQLISGSAGLARENDLDINYKKPVGGKSTLSMEGNTFSFMPINAGAYPWAFKLNSSVPVSLSLEQAVGMQNLDLQDVHAEELNSSLAVGTITITVPQDIDFSGKIECAVGQVVIRIPKGSNVVIRTDNAIVPVIIPQTYQ